MCQWIKFPVSIIGGAKEDRTPDLLRAKQALSQLSYGPLLVFFFSSFVEKKNPAQHSK